MAGMGLGSEDNRVRGVGAGRGVRRPGVIALYTCIALASLPASTLAQGSADRMDAGVMRHPLVDSVARSLIASETPGLALLAVRGGQVVHRASYGSTAIEGGQPVGLNTSFYVASVGKMFTAAAILGLVDEGRLGLDDRLGQLLPAAPPYASEVTVRSLLDHTSGVPDHYDIGGEDRTWSNAEVIETLAQADGLRFETGTRASYSNSGYVLLSMLVEEVSGVTFGEFMEERFFGPLGMGSTFVVDETGTTPHERTTGYSQTPDGWAQNDYASTTTGAGGVYSSLADLERWATGLREGRVLSDRALALASRPPELPGGRLTPYGMGWLAEFHAQGPLANRWYVFAFGSLNGFRAAFQWYQDSDDLLIWMINSDSGAAVDAIMGLGEALFGGQNPAG